MAKAPPPKKEKNPSPADDDDIKKGGRDENDDPPPKKKGNPLKLVIIVVAAMVVGGGGAFAAMKLLGGHSAPAPAPAEQEAAAGEEEAVPPPAAPSRSGGHGEPAPEAGGGHGEAAPAEAPAGPVNIEFKPFIVNLSDLGGRRMLKLTMSVEAETPELADEINAKMPQFRDVILMLLSSIQSDDVSSLDGKQRLKNQMLNRINPNLTKGKVKNLYFSEMVVQ